jgi:hypothetical protein
MPAPKVALLTAPIFINFKTLAMACVNFTIITPIGLTGAFRPVLGWKTNLPLNLFRFGGLPHTCHCHGYAFSCKRWFDFLTDKLTNDWYLVDTGVTLSIVPRNQHSSPSGPLLRAEQKGSPSPLGVLLKKTAIPRQTFYINLSASSCGWPHSGH